MAEQDFWQSILEYCSDVQTAIPRLESVPRNSKLIEISPFSEDLIIVDDIFQTKDLLDTSDSIPSLCESSEYITDPASRSLSKSLSLQSNPPEWDISNWSCIPAASMVNEIMNPTNEFSCEGQKLAGDVKQNTEPSWNDMLPEIEISSPHRLSGSLIDLTSIQTHPDHLTGTSCLFGPLPSNISADVKPNAQISDVQHGWYCSTTYISPEELQSDQLFELSNLPVEVDQVEQINDNKQLVVLSDPAGHIESGIETALAISSDESISTSHHNLCPPSNMPAEAIEYTFPQFYYNLSSMPETSNAIYPSYSSPVISDDPSFINSTWNRVNQKTTISAPSAQTRAGSHQRGSVDRLTDITLNELSHYFNMPITQAAKELKVGLTVLKKKCREFGIPRWPHRKMKSLESLINNIQELGKNNGGLSNARLRNAVQILEEQKRLMEEMPGIELAERTKRLRQACFKASYKKRRQMAMESANLGGSEGSTSSASATQTPL